MMSAQSFIYDDNAPSDVVIFTTTKFGGYSSGNYDSFNCGIFTHDDISCVLKNIEYLKQSCKIDKLALLKQVHGNSVLEVSKKNFADIYLAQADGLITHEKNIALGIFAADCFPLFLVGKKYIAALHCGWRGLNSNIIENAISILQQNGDFPIYAYAGPGICKDCYEVKDDMICKLNPAYNPSAALITENGKTTLDLKLLLENAIKVCKIPTYNMSMLSTCCSGFFYSHRKSGGNTGRMLSVIMRKG